MLPKNIHSSSDIPTRKRLHERFERGLGDMWCDGRCSADASGSHGGVRITEAASDGGEHLREVGGEPVSMCEGQRREQVHALLSHESSVGSVGGMYTGQEDWERRRIQRASNRVELRRRKPVGVTVWELREANQHSLLQALWRRSSGRCRRHCCSRAANSSGADVGDGGGSYLLGGGSS